MFSEIVNQYNWNDVESLIKNKKSHSIPEILQKDSFNKEDIAALLSPGADSYLEEIAQKSYSITRQRFGNTIQLYAPLYISNECTNSCIYCGFSAQNTINRTTLNDDEILQEAHKLYETGFRHILLLTGEHPKAVPLERLASIARKLHEKFPSLSIEVYPLDVDGYKELAKNGIDGLTLYQETYNKEVYSTIHPAGKKRDYTWRLDGPDRGGIAQLRRIGIGSLLGLSDWRTEGFFTALHGLYLMKTYWRTNISISFPRLRQAAGSFEPYVDVDDRALTHLICVMRILMPDAGLILSTRESATLRDNLIPIGITMMSAGSKTNPGGYTDNIDSDGQFSIEDTRSPDEIARTIKSKGFDAVWKDWDKDFILS